MLKFIRCLTLACLCAEAAAQQLPPTLTLEGVVATYLRNSLEIQAARFRVDRTRADLIGARLRPNPGLTVVTENFPITGPTPFSRLYEIGATYTETIELGGKRELREKVATANITAAELQFEDTMRRGIAEVKRLYFNALLARYNLETAVENRRTFDLLVQFNVARFQEGAIPELELIKVRLERVRFDSTVKQAELVLRESVIRLLERMGQTDMPALAIGGELALSSANFDLASFRQFASSERTDVRAAAAAVSAANERLALEKARAKPDISPFAGYKRVGSDNTLLAGVTIPLKVRDRNEAEIARAEADLRSAEVRLRLTRTQALAEVEAGYAAVQSARELADSIRNDLLRQADEAQSITIAAYEEGGTELLPVLDAQRTRAEIRQQYFKTLFDYQAGVVALELAVGREFQP